MRKITLLILFLTLSVSMLSAQSVEAVKSQLEKYPDLAMATYTTYPAIPLESIAAAPEGYEPFYLSNFSRHGSRYQNALNKGYYTEKIAMLKLLNKAGLLTDTGRQIYKYMREAQRRQRRWIGELSPLGARQLYAMGERAYERFTPIFKEGGRMEGISSEFTRCIESLQNFIDGIESREPKMEGSVESSKAVQAILRPYDAFGEEYDKAKRREYALHRRGGAWRQEQRRWSESHTDIPALKQIFTDVDAALALAGKNHFDMGYSLFGGLLFMKNFEVGDATLHTRLFSQEELYAFYIYKSFDWMCSRSCEGLKVMNTRIAHIRPMLMHIIDNIDAVVEGRSDVKAHLRCTHDTNIMPLMTLFGFEEAVAHYYENDIERSAVSAFVSKAIPMGANVQIVLYRNNGGEILARTLLNEQDAALPIESIDGLFYRWKDLRTYLLGRLSYYERLAKESPKN